jgi:hypothetical protein
MRSLSWDDTLDLLAREQITDLVVAGLVEADKPDGPAHLFFSEVYLEFGDHGYLELASVNSHGGLRARHVDVVDLAVLRDEFEPDRPVTVSLAALYFGEASELECVEVNWVTNEESDPARGIVRCVELVTRYEQRIFFDPMFLCGVRIGNAGEWMSGYQTRPRLSWRRHTWSRPAT